MFKGVPSGVSSIRYAKENSEVKRCPEGFYGPNKDGTCLQTERTEKECGETCAFDQCNQAPQPTTKQRDGKRQKV